MWCGAAAQRVRILPKGRTKKSRTADVSAYAGVSKPMEWNRVICPFISPLRLTIRLLFAYTAAMSEERDRGALLIAACVVAAVPLRGEPIQPSPKLKATIYDSVQLAMLVWREIQGSGPIN